MQAKDFKQDSLQIAIFTPSLKFVKNNILTKLMEDFSSFFDGDTIVVPIHQDAPKEIPRIILQGRQGVFKLEVAESRVNCFVSRQPNVADSVIDVNGFIALAKRIFSSYKNFTDATIGRLAMVGVKYLMIETPGVLLAQHFCKDRWLVEPFNRPESFELHSHKRYGLRQFTVNSWVRCQTGQLVATREKAMVVTQDINTLPEELEAKNFSLGDLNEFIDAATVEQESILKLYFPNE